MAALVYVLMLFGFFALMGWLAWLDHLSDRERMQAWMDRRDKT